ncbi:trypco2 family protein [Kribbella sp. C-35]|uniref:trypco2 family protein n=1 Tax=Kribbella sp. C-35 TaxID=2789276 RepID=UPI00397DF5C7
MASDSEPLGLVDFLADLHADLEAAQKAALQRGGEVRLGVEEVTITLDVVHERTTSGEMGGKVTGRFWVFGSAEASGSGAHSATRSGTQSLTMTLRPRVSTTTIDDQGRRSVTHTGLDVSGAVGDDEQQPPPPVSGPVRYEGQP